MRCVQFDFLLAGKKAFSANDHLLFILLVAIGQVSRPFSAHVHLVARSNGLVAAGVADTARLSSSHLVQRKPFVHILLLKVLGLHGVSFDASADFVLEIMLRVTIVLFAVPSLCVHSFNAPTGAP